MGFRGFRGAKPRLGPRASAWSGNGKVSGRKTPVWALLSWICLGTFRGGKPPSGRTSVSDLFVYGHETLTGRPGPGLPAPYSLSDPGPGAAAAGRRLPPKVEGFRQAEFRLRSKGFDRSSTTKALAFRGLNLNGSSLQGLSLKGLNA